MHEGQSRGSGAVIIWDEGTAEMVRDEPGHVSFVLHGRKLSGGFALTRTGERRWILVKVRDEAARPGSDIVTEQPASVRSGRTWQELLRQLKPWPRGMAPRRRAAQPDGTMSRVGIAPGEQGRLAVCAAIRSFETVETFSGRKSMTAEPKVNTHMNMATGGSRGTGGNISRDRMRSERERRGQWSHCRQGRA